MAEAERKLIFLPFFGCYDGHLRNIGAYIAEAYLFFWMWKGAVRSLFSKKGA